MLGFGIFPLSPAYGRDYKNGLEVSKDFLAGKDFRCVNGQYCSCRDFPGMTVEIRYDKNQKFTLVQVPASR